MIITFLKFIQRRKMKRVALVCLLASSIAGARELDGPFVGFETGSGRSQMTANGRDLANVDWSEKITMNAMVFGGKLGYKYFFSDMFGIRGYASLARSESSTKWTSEGQTAINIELPTLIYTANADVLVNFAENGNGIFGAFAGLGLGGQSWSGKATLAGQVAFDEETNAFYMDAKVGLRALSGNHGIDFIVKIPFINAKKKVNGVSAKSISNYQILLGYNYSF